MLSWHAFLLKNVIVVNTKRIAITIFASNFSTTNIQQPPSF
jgi:hypothetical protein